MPSGTSVIFSSSIECLGHIVANKDKLVDPKKVKVIAKWTIPRDKIEMWSFLGFPSYYWRFVKWVSKIAIHVTTLLKGYSDFVNWTSDCDLSFLNFKIALILTFILIIMNPLKECIVLCTDFSDLAIDIVLIQERKMFAYEYCKLNFVELLPYAWEQNACSSSSLKGAVTLHVGNKI